MATNPNANLQIGVGLDLGQLRADKIKLEQEIRDLNRTAGVQARAGDAAGLAVTGGSLVAHEAQLAAVTRRYNEATKGAQGLRDTLREIADHGERMRSAFEMGGSFVTGGGIGVVGGITQALLRGGPLAIGGTAAVAAAGGGAFLANKAADYAHEITNLALQLGMTTGQTEGFAEAARKAGAQMELFWKVLERISIAADKASRKDRDLAIDAAALTADDSGIVARGGRTSAFKSTARTIGGYIPVTDEDIGLYAAQQLNLRKDAALAMARQGQATAPLPDLQTYIAQLRSIASQDNAEGAKLRANIRDRGGNVGFANEREALESLKTKGEDAFHKLGIAVNDANNKMRPFIHLVKELDEALRRSTGPEATAILREIGGRGAINTLINKLLRSPELAEAASSTAGDNESIAKGAEAKEALLRLEGQATKASIDLGMAIIDFTSKAVSALHQGAAAITSGLEQSGAPFAEGGYVSGPGTGTSDSILARVSNGEFVVNAMATSRNLALLRAINGGGYAEGGLIGFPSLPRFADGGMVGGSTPVHVHIGGNEYQMRASENVASALVSAAHSQQMRSAGAKPTWMR